jgi:transcriptional regulator with XRE-family HTH domain
MIRNEREYRITKARAGDFVKSLEALRTTPRSDLDPGFVEIQRSAVRSQLEDLQEQLGDYEALRDGRREVLELAGLEELPRGLIEGRIAAGLTQKDLAEKLGLRAQQVQRYESTDYAGASFARLLDVANAVGLTFREEVFLPAVEVSADALVERVRDAGLDRDFVLRVLLDDRYEDESESDSARLALRGASAAQRIFGWVPKDVLAGAEPLTTPSVAHAPAFKLYAAAEELRTAVLATYGRYIARLVAKATPSLRPQSIPTDPKEFRALVEDGHETVDLAGLLSTLWDLGVVVIPLGESGGFHGACWRFDGRNVIVLKQGTRTEARWMYDLLHETFHAGSEPDEPDMAWLDDDTAPIERRNSVEEKRANRFAGNVLLAGQAEPLAKECVRRANAKANQLKGVVPDVAEENRVSVGALANYLAWRLEMDGVNWWGAAANLQRDGRDPWLVVRDFLLARLEWTQLDRLDRELLSKALEEP